MSEFHCQAFSVEQPSATFYVAAVKVQELESICQPLSRPIESGPFDREVNEPIVLSEAQFNSLVRSLSSKIFHEKSLDLLSEERLRPYQRYVDEKRAVEISRYLQQPMGLLPNSIILAVNINFDESEIIQNIGDKHFKITLPKTKESAVILDGQHRVRAFNYVEGGIKENYEMIVVFLIGIPFYQQAELFAIINGKQKPVNRSIIYDLFGYAPVGEAREDELYTGLMAIERFCSHVTRIVNRADESPWRSKVKMRGPGDEGVISQAAVVQYLSVLVEPKTCSKRLKLLPSFYPFFKNNDPIGCAALIILYLSAIKIAQKQIWDNTKSLFWKNNGVAVIFRILHDDLILAGSTVNLMNNFKKIVERWKKAPEADLNNPPKTGGGGVQNQLYEKFKSVMYSSSELQDLPKKGEQMKNTLIEIGGLV